MNHRFYIVTIFLFFTTSIILAQNPPRGIGNVGNGGFNTGGGFSGGGTPQSGKVVRDTSKTYFFFANAPGQEYPLNDTLLSEYFLQHDYIRRLNLDWAHLGNVGSAAHPLSFQHTFRQGFDIGLNAFDIYQIEKEELRFFRVQQAFSRAYFSQGATQREIVFGAEFAREFANNFTLGIDYQRINNTGQYQNQLARNTAFAVSGWKVSKNGRYKSFFSYLNNKNEQLENGGIQSELFDGQGRIENPIVPLPTLVNVRNIYKNSSFNYKQYYQINKSKADSLQQGQRAFTLVHDASWETSSFKFTDSNPAPDTSYYKILQTDDRGLRHYIDHWQIENAFYFNTSKTKKDGEISQQNDLIEAGILHRYHALNQEPKDTTFQEIFLTGRVQFTPNERLKINTSAHLGLVGSIGDYRLNGDAFLDVGKVGKLQLAFTQTLSRPTLIQEQIYISQRPLWQNDFKKTLTTSAFGQYSLPLINFSVAGHYHLLNNPIYYDTLAVPQQAETIANVLQLTVNQNVKLGNFHLDNQVTLQQSTQDFLRLPPIYSVNSLYFEGTLFKKAMYTKLGFDLRLNAPYRPYSYQPLHGQFHLQDQQEVNWQPLVDVFFAAKVQKLRALVRYENVLPVIFGKPYYYQIAGYPVPHGYLRFAVSWQFVD